ncbi:hypothetical protein HYG81_25290 (plasmid) [Natrinema zhouii]|uniref:hypothetical protein n=1 Tax=Natrinema zhouii TaxID=1710539 RepID=UPI001CFF993E|nr:hypothetical protein [Natrinema zhouii]UHQ99060.1 hypothetical protein HYG81_25290 [Natrinema zhouii]
MLGQQIVGDAVVFVVAALAVRILTDLDAIEHSARDLARRDACEQSTDRQCQLPLEVYSRFSSPLLRQQKSVSPIELDTGS